MRIFLTLFLALMAWSLQAQVTASRYVFATAGTASSSTGLNASSTIGEPIIGTVTTSPLVVTQGFQQTEDGTVSIETPWTDRFALTAYPNPVADHLTLELTGTLDQPLQVQLFDARGRAMPGWGFEIRQPGQIQRSTQALASGAYFLRVSQAGSGQTQTLSLIRR